MKMKARSLFFSLCGVGVVVFILASTVAGPPTEVRNGGETVDVAKVLAKASLPTLDALLLEENLESLADVRCCDTSSGSWYHNPYYMPSQTCQESRENGAVEGSLPAKKHCRLTRVYPTDSIPTPEPPAIHLLDNGGGPGPGDVEFKPGKPKKVPPFRCGGCQYAPTHPPHAELKAVGGGAVCNGQAVPHSFFGEISDNVFFEDTSCSGLSVFIYVRTKGQLSQGTKQTLAQDRQRYEREKINRIGGELPRN